MGLRTYTGIVDLAYGKQCLFLSLPTTNRPGPTVGPPLPQDLQQLKKEALIKGGARGDALASSMNQTVQHPKEFVVRAGWTRGSGESCA